MNNDSETSRLEPLIIGTILILVGAFIFWWEDRIVKMGGNSPRLPGFGWITILVPGMIVSGIVIIVRGLVWKASAFSSRTVFLCGLFMLIPGAFPWFYTGRGEGGGMLGTLLFVSLGVPGLIITVVGFLLGGTRKEE